METFWIFAGIASLVGALLIGIGVIVITWIVIVRGFTNSTLKTSSKFFHSFLAVVGGIVFTIGVFKGVMLLVVIAGLQGLLLLF